MHGDGNYTTEYYGDGRPSVFNNGTQKNIVNVNGSKVSGEISDAAIIDYFMENAYSDILNVRPTETTKPSVTREYTPENITSLKPNEVFVFGSNTEGRHGAGAAKTAVDKFGAKYGQAEGLQGQSYAIVTKNLTSGIEMFGRKITKTGERSIERFEIREQLEDLMSFAENNPDKKFYVTKLGTSLAGFSTSEIKELFEKIKDTIPNNVILPKEFEVRSVTVSFESAFPAERQKEIVNNFATKHNMTEEQALEYINNAIATKGQEAIDKLKECY